MPFTYVGLVPGNLASGRPLVFGDVLDSVEPEDEARLGDKLVQSSKPSAPSAPPVPSTTTEA